jgi:hypothetical protein
MGYHAELVRMWSNYGQVKVLLLENGNNLLFLLLLLWIVYLSTNIIEVKVVTPNLKDSHRRHICYCRPVSNILSTVCRYVYDLYQQQISHT